MHTNLMRTPRFKMCIRDRNRATQSKRQPGSSIKPLSVYAPAVDMGKITEVDTVTDEEITIGNDKWKPKNSYNDFLGDMTIKEAVARSANIPAVKVLDMVNLTNSFNYLQNKFHITTLEEKDKNYSSLALGGLTPVSYTHLDVYKRQSISLNTSSSKSSASSNQVSGPPIQTARCAPPAALSPIYPKWPVSGSYS